MFVNPVRNGAVSKNIPIKTRTESAYSYPFFDAINRPTTKGNNNNVTNTSNLNINTIDENPCQKPILDCVISVPGNEALNDVMEMIPIIPIITYIPNRMIFFFL